MAINQIRPESSSHQPPTPVRLRADAIGLEVRFDVEVRFMIVRERGFNGPVHLDSCVEMFIEPPSGGGYINFTKCADQSSGKHWMSWAPLTGLDFHRPHEFGHLCIQGVDAVGFCT